MTHERDVVAQNVVTPPRPTRVGGVVALALLLLAGGAAAQPVAEVVAGVESLSGPYADGRSVGAQLTVPQARGYVQATAAVLDRFGQETLVLGATAARNVGARWVATGSAGGSTAGIIAPRARASVGIGRRWARRANVLTTVTAGLRETRDGHRDLDLTAEAAVYGERAVVQVGARATRSAPGPAWGARAFAAVVADVGGAEVSARLGLGREAWVVVAPDDRLDVAFRSGEAAVSVRRPVAGRWGVVAEAGLYANPFYTRVGLRTGLSRTF